MAKNADKINTGSFPTMGNVAAPVNASGVPSRNTKAVAKKGAGVGGMLEGATARYRGPVLNEPNGPQHRITASAYAPQTNPEAGATFRNVRVVKSAIGNRDFWDKRNNGV